MELSVEYSPEFIKQWCYEGKTVNKFDQYYVFGVECLNQSRLFNKVDYVISDSPVLLTGFYNYYYNKGDNSLSEACKGFYKKAAEDGIEVLNFFLPRKKRYVTKGRFQTEAEADEVAVMLKEWLAKEGYEYTELTCPDRDRLDAVMSIIEQKVGGFNGMVVA